MRPQRAKLIQVGAGQAVRLPKEFQFPDDQTEVLIRREGRKIILEPMSVWPAEFVACPGAWDEEIERPPQQAKRSARALPK